MEISYFIIQTATFCPEAAHAAHGEFAVGCPRPFDLEEGGGFLLYRGDGAAPLWGRQFARAEVGRAGRHFTQCVKPVVACLSSAHGDGCSTRMYVCN